jgi:hypothetical protein
MANTFTDEQVQDSLNRIAAPAKRVVAPDGRAVEYRSTDEEIKAQQYMVNANRSAAGTRRRQTRLMSSKGF